MLIQVSIFCSVFDWTPLASLTILPALSLLIAAPLAWISWKLIEKPFIALGRKGVKSKI
jgi:peptidoglycan/LPS O-acetylase OafA/YrhL